MIRRTYKFCAALMLLTLFTGVSMAGTITGTAKFASRKKHADILVFLEKVGENKFAPPQEHAVMDQLNLVFLPFSLPVVSGTSVDFHNGDTVLHNVFTPDKEADKFNLGTWAKGEVRSYAFKKLGSAVILCNVHPEMEAYVVTLPNPYFAVTDDEGKFTIPAKPNAKDAKDRRPAPPELPAGKYILHAWHPRAKVVTQEVTVTEKGAVTVNLELPRGSGENVSTIFQNK